MGTFPLCNTLERIVRPPGQVSGSSPVDNSPKRSLSIGYTQFSSLLIANRRAARKMVVGSPQERTWGRATDCTLQSIAQPGAGNGN
jgi:hypothetical protein